ncbi:MAG: TRAP transporter large permease subunit [Alphaproteobacteria bacterium]|nr:TRAP transporter large permease subunit [Alphaproteobacteria bacterium]
MLTTTMFLLLVMLAFAVPVAATLGVLGIALDQLYSDGRLLIGMADTTWLNSIEPILVAIPMFVMLGEILLRAGIAEKMYNSLSHWLAWLPGGNMHANVGSCALFAATCGSSVATAATVGIVALPEIQRRGYNERLFLGTIAAGGTLGILIPPSINMIIYGLLTNSSVPQLYLAGFIPGFMLAGMFSLCVLVLCIIKPAWGGEKISFHLPACIATLPHLLPPVGIFMVVVGSIYAGFATPTEAASLGVIAALGLAAANGALSWTMIGEMFIGTMRTTAMVMLIILAAVFLNFVLAQIGLTKLMTDFVVGLGYSPTGTMIAIIIFYVILGCFMETLSMMLTTTPLIFPIVVSLGFDPIWFGIVQIILLETALVTPPVGVNLYVVQGIRSSGTINDVIIGIIPFLLSMFLMIALLMVFPQIALFLPQYMMGGN